jgi:4-aminobutyrate aminotransferase-like enzyme/Ser/Thr protein kinase RdoA (MazF antagonist)
MLIAKAKRPDFSEQDAERLARELFGIFATAKQLTSERDQNFHLRSQSGEEYVLKIANTREDKGTLDFQNQAMEHIANQSPSTACPRVCTTSSGETIVTVESAGGATHHVRLLTYLRGTPLADVRTQTPELLQSLGRFLGTMDKALEDFSHRAAHRKFHWDLKNAGAVISGNIDHIADSRKRLIAEHFLKKFEMFIEPAQHELRQSFIHNDGNDHNIITALQEPNGENPIGRRVTGIVDFGDAVYSYTVNELAVAIAYVMLGKEDPISEAAHVVKGYNDVLPLTELEIELLFTLACLRLSMSVTISACQQELEPDNEYLKISEKPAWLLLECLIDMSLNWANYVFRHACSLPPCPQSHAISNWLEQAKGRIGRVTKHDLQSASTRLFDLSIGSPDFGCDTDVENMEVVGRTLKDKMDSADAPVGISRYSEARLVLTDHRARPDSSEVSEKKTIHLGIDLFLEAGTDVFASLEGTIHSFSDASGHPEHGSTIILQHETADGSLFFTLYGHLSEDSLKGFSEGNSIRSGDQIGRVAGQDSDDSQLPHLHFQLIADMLDRTGDFPRFCRPSQRDIWLSICPDPNIILGVPDGMFPAGGRTGDDIIMERELIIGRSLSISYRRPLKIVRGAMQYLYDDNGRAYLDAVNNVPHVGHCHPRVVRAAQRQMALLNTNTRYLHDMLVEYAKRLCSTMPDPLGVCFFVCTGSEANELAIRLAKAHTKNTDFVVVEGAYHGNTGSLIDLSSYKFDGPGGKGPPSHVHKVIMPDVYRGIHKSDHPNPGIAYAEHVREAVTQLHTKKRSVCAFFCESLPGCGGQIVLPDRYLQEAYRHIRDAGGVCVADEVQVGFGRVGSHFWGFQTQDVVPDIVTLGKPMGNGHPVAAVVTTPEIAASFDNGMEYFNTYGGNPVSCAVGLAVLEVIRDENLQENARRVGTRLKAGLANLMHKHPLIGDVRGLGLFIGVELVTDRHTLTPAAAHASYIVERMKDLGILISTDGPLHNVLKIKPPLVFSEANADLLVSMLDRILEEFRQE